MTKNAVVFPGQGSQIVGMGKDLFDNFLCAKEIFQEVDDILSFNLSKLMFEGPSEELMKTENTQPALMATSVAIVKVLEKEFDKKISDICSYVAGHSLGEYSALCATKALSLKETTKLLQIRGKAMAKCGVKTSGAMSAILGVEIDVAKKIAEESAQGEICQIANDNSVGQIVISGSKSAIERSIEIAKIHGAKRAIMLPVSGAFHSELMNDAMLEMKDALKDVKLTQPIVPLIANVTADITTNPDEIRDLLVKQVVSSVRWRETMLYLEKNSVSKIIEIGSGKVLCGLVTRTCKDISTISIQNFDDIKSFS